MLTIEERSRTADGVCWWESIVDMTVVKMRELGDPGKSSKPKSQSTHIRHNPKGTHSDMHTFL